MWGPQIPIRSLGWPLMRRVGLSRAGGARENFSPHLCTTLPHAHKLANERRRTAYGRNTGAACAYARHMPPVGVPTLLSRTQTSCFAHGVLLNRARGQRQALPRARDLLYTHGRANFCANRQSALRMPLEIVTGTFLMQYALLPPRLDTCRASQVHHHAHKSAGSSYNASPD